MNRGQKRSYKKLHENDERATYCDTCKMKTLSIIKLPPLTEDFYTTEFICEVCGEVKYIHKDLSSCDGTTHISIYEENLNDQKGNESC